MIMMFFSYRVEMAKNINTERDVERKPFFKVQILNGREERANEDYNDQRVAISSACPTASKLPGTRFIHLKREKEGGEIIRLGKM